MGKIFCSVLISGLLSVGPIQAQEPYAFNGIRFGIPVSEQDQSIIFKPTGNEGRYSVSNLPDIGIDRELVSVDTIGGNIEFIIMSFKARDSQEFASLITEKFGKPHQEIDREVQTIGGAKLTDIYRRWTTPGFDIIMLGRTPSDVTKSGLMVKSQKYIRMKEEKDALRKSKAKGNL